MSGWVCFFQIKGFSPVFLGVRVLSFRDSSLLSSFPYMEGEDRPPLSYPLFTSAIKLTSLGWASGTTTGPDGRAWETGPVTNILCHGVPRGESGNPEMGRYVGGGRVSRPCPRFEGSLTGVPPSTTIGGTLS